MQPLLYPIPAVFRYFRYALLLLALSTELAQAQTPALYFPPTTGSTWATTTPASLGWCQPKLNSLIAFAGRKSSKSLLILKDDRPVVHRYHGTYPANSAWH